MEWYALRARNEMEYGRMVARWHQLCREAAPAALVPLATEEPLPWLKPHVSRVVDWLLGVPADFPELISGTPAERAYEAFRLGSAAETAPPLTSPMPEPMRLLAELRERRRPADHLVACLGDHPWAYAGALYAVWRLLPFVVVPGVVQLEELGRRFRPTRLTIAASPAQISGQLLKALQSTSLRKVQLAFLSGRSPETAIDLVARSMTYSRLPPNRHVCLLAAEGALNQAGGDGADLELVPDTSAGHMSVMNRLLAEEPAETLSLLGSGRDDWFWLRRGLICGRAVAAPLPDPKPASGLPHCAYTGKCFRPERRLIDAAQIRARTIMLNQCFSFKPAGGIYTQDFSLLLRFLDGWPCAVVSNPFPSDGRTAQNLLFHGLVQNGHDLGTAVHATNLASVHAGLDSPSMFLVGDPLYQPSRHPPIPPRTWHPDEGPLNIRSGAQNFVEIRIASGNWRQELLTGTRRIRFTGRVPRHSPVYYSLVPMGDEALSLCIYSPSRLPALQVSTDRIVPRLEFQRLHGEMNRLAASLSDLGLEVPDARHHLQALERQLVRAAEPLSHARYSVKSAQQCEALLERALDRHRAVHEAVADWLLTVTSQTNFQFSEHHRTYYQVTRHEWTDDTCPYCAAPIQVLTLAHHVSSSIRTLCQCPTCGTLRDTGNPNLHLQIQGAPFTDVNHPLSLGVAIYNRSNTDIQGWLVMTPLLGDIMHLVPAPPRHVVTVPAEGEVHIPLAITPLLPAVRPHHYFMRVYLVAGGEVEMAARGFWLIDSGH